MPSTVGQTAGYYANQTRWIQSITATKIHLNRIGLQHIYYDIVFNY